MPCPPAGACASWRGVLGRWSCDNRGVSAVVLAVSFAALMAATALAVDVGSVFLSARRLQGLADLTAISAAQDLNGAANAQSQAQSAAQATVNANAWAVNDSNGQPITPSVSLGVYTPDPTQPAANRFTATATAPNAARVTLTMPVHLYFGGMILGRNTFNISRTATAASTQLVAFSIGTGLASVNGGVANALLSALTGSSVSLSVMNYNALLGAKVDLLTYLSALSTRLNLTAGTYNSLLSGQISTPTALSALGDALNAQGQTAAATAVNQLASASVSAPGVQLSALFDLGPYGNQDHGFSTGGAAVSLNAMSVVSALLTAAQGGRQLQLDLTAALPGVASATAFLAIGQRAANSPWMTITQSQSVIVRTAQTRLYIQVSVGSTVVNVLNGLLNPLGALLGGNSTTSVTGNGLVNLDAYVELASAQAKLSALTCSRDPTKQAVSLQVLPSLGTVAVAQVANPSTLNDFSTPVTLTPDLLLNLPPLLTASIYANISVGGGNAAWQTVNFNATDIANGAMKTVTTNDIAQATLASLLSNTSISVNPLGGGGITISTSVISPLLMPVIQPVGAALDGVINQLTALAGVQLGTATVWVDGVRCNGSALVG
ncbi:TadG family pilus assembly protein [Caulobacter sp. S45]|uniref:TadG family pilus assembly protein n=1 Tax=Caulobacter sp. S45 TaxID=1641861 RepID=UPI00131BDF3C|nr:TadG family pilus assembly protein [Caulobacter sp. S45]